MNTKTLYESTENEKGENTFPSQIIDWIKNNSNSSFNWLITILAISAIVTVITNYKKIYDLGMKVFFKKEKFNKLFTSTERESNPRFGFSFLYPDLWDRFVSDNGDGNTFVHPNDDKTRIFAWGSYSLESDLNSTLKKTLEYVSRNKKYKLIKNVESGKYIRGENSRSQIEGVRIEYSYKDDNRVRIFVMQSITYYEGKEFSIMCQTKFKGKNELTEDFLKITGSLLVIEETYIS